MYLITGPLKLTVELMGEARDAQSSRAEIYIRGHYTVNGKSHWLQDSGTNAIWYYKDHWNLAGGYIPSDTLSRKFPGKNLKSTHTHSF